MSSIWLTLINKYVIFLWGAFCIVKKYEAAEEWWRHSFRILTFPSKKRAMFCLEIGIKIFFAKIYCKLGFWIRLNAIGSFWSEMILWPWCKIGSWVDSEHLQNSLVFKGVLLQWIWNERKIYYNFCCTRKKLI